MQTPNKTIEAARHARHRRARRGLVAAYIHELSTRHAADVRAIPRPAPQPARSA